LVEANGPHDLAKLEIGHCERLGFSIITTCSTSQALGNSKKKCRCSSRNALKNNKLVFTLSIVLIFWWMISHLCNAYKIHLDGNLRCHVYETHLHLSFKNPGQLKEPVWASLVKSLIMRQSSTIHYTHLVTHAFRRLCIT
jgi:hypothetical protein